MKHFTTTFVSCVFSVLMLYPISYPTSRYNTIYKSRLIVLSSVLTYSVASGQKSDCNVLAYDTVRGFLNWPQEWFKKAALTSCNQRVIFSEDKKDISKANVVVFHAPTHGTSGPKLPTKRDKDKLYAMVSMEQPKYAQYLADLKYLNNNFNLTVTYSLASIYPGTKVPNLPITYYPLNIVSTQAVMQPPRPYSEKTGFDTGVHVVLFASNCDRAGATERYKYIEELMKHIQVHSYGKCFNNRKEPAMPDDPSWPAIAQRRARKVKVLSRYKFYLAFENAPVDDYVSEKVFEGLIAGTVSVYRGAESIHKFMPSNTSFIDANKLSAKELATKLQSFAKNEVEYNKFFDFKKAPLSPQFEKMASMSYVHPNVLCRLCDYYTQTVSKG